MLDREADLRATKRYQPRPRQAKLRIQATIEDVDFRARRGLDKTLLLSLADCRWVTAGHNFSSSVRPAAARHGWPRPRPQSLPRDPRSPLCPPAAPRR